jgi:hypothetical protein
VVEHPLEEGREAGGFGGVERVGQRRKRCRHLSGAGGERFVTRGAEGDVDAASVGRLGSRRMRPASRCGRRARRPMSGPARAQGQLADGQLPVSEESTKRSCVSDRSRSAASLVRAVSDHPLRMPGPAHARSQRTRSEMLGPRQRPRPIPRSRLRETVGFGCRSRACATRMTRLRSLRRSSSGAWMAHHRL